MHFCQSFQLRDEFVTTTTLPSRATNEQTLRSAEAIAGVRNRVVSFADHCRLNGLASGFRRRASLHHSCYKQHMQCLGLCRLKQHGHVGARRKIRIDPVTATLFTSAGPSNRDSADRR